MTKPSSVACLLLTLLLAPGAATAQQRFLRGQVLLVDKNDTARPANKGEVRLLGFGNPTRITPKDGAFRLFLPERLQPGDPITLFVELQGYRLWSPPEGKTLIPQDSATQPVELRLLPVGSRRFLSGEGIERMLRHAVETSREQTTANGEPQRFDLSRSLADWARHYGLRAEQVKAEVNRWVAEVEKNREDEHRLALAAFARGDFKKAAELAESSAGHKRQRFEQWKQKSGPEQSRKAAVAEHAKPSAERKRQHSEPQEPEDDSKRAKKSSLAAPPEPPAEPKHPPTGQQDRELVLLGEEIARDLELKADAQLQGEDFTGALETCTQALNYVTREQSPRQWAALMTSVGNVHGRQGRQTQGPDALAHLEQAVAAYRSALEAQTRETLPREWATTQHHLGVALRTQGERTEGEDGARLLSQAVEAFRLALLVRTREALPLDWKSTQDSLDLALEAQQQRARRPPSSQP